MNRLIYTKILVFLLVISVFGVSCSNFSARSASRKAEKQMAGSSRSVRKVRESRKVRMAKAAQERNQSRLKKEYKKSVTRSRKRTYDIQSPDVQARMKRNDAKISEREKEKDKKSRSESRKRAKKFR